MTANRPRQVPGQDGYVLLAVLWLLVGASVVGLGVRLAAREAVATSMNRMDLRRAAWRAEECLAIARTAIDDVLKGRAGRGAATGSSWADLDRAVAESSVLRASGCELSFRPVGAALDVNAADGGMLRAALDALGVEPARADSLVAALLDWMDPDDIPRTGGAERSWYEARGAFPPRNGPIADARELQRIRGFGAVPLEGVFDVEAGRICLLHAHPAVLAALPGFTPEAVDRVLALRRGDGDFPELPALAARLSQDARARLMASFADLALVATTLPDAWILVSRARVGRPPVTAVVELRLVRAGTRAAVVRRRTWIE